MQVVLPELKVSLLVLDLIEEKTDHLQASHILDPILSLPQLVAVLAVKVTLVALKVVMVVQEVDQIIQHHLVGQEQTILDQLSKVFLAEIATLLRMVAAVVVVPVVLVEIVMAQVEVLVVLDYE